jgi:hypothetical protein
LSRIWSRHSGETRSTVKKFSRLDEASKPGFSETEKTDAVSIRMNRQSSRFYSVISRVNVQSADNKIIRDRPGLKLNITAEQEDDKEKEFGRPTTRCRRK